MQHDGRLRMDHFTVAAAYGECCAAVEDICAGKATMQPVGAFRWRPCHVKTPLSGSVWHLHAHVPQPAAAFLPARESASVMNACGTPRPCCQYWQALTLTVPLMMNCHSLALECLNRQQISASLVRTSSKLTCSKVSGAALEA